ncbi:MAG: hypothetical protein J6C01_01860 [Lachnospiraceae bacterium]|nr:hypothetical protein [Lachnospiraceae bacterium]
MEPVVINDTVSNNKGGMLKKIKMILLILIGIAVLFLAACIAIKSYNHSKYQDEFYVQQEALEYMQERYNEEFIVMYNRGMGGAYNYVQLYAYPVTHRDEMHKIEIQGYYNKWGKLDFYDDYVMVRLTEEYEAYVDPIIDEYFDEYKFYIDFNAEWLRNNLSADTKLEDLWELKAGADYPLPEISLFIKLDDESMKRKLDTLVQDLSVSDIRCTGYVAFIKENKKYELLIDDWNANVDGLDYKNDIATFFIYDDNNYKLRIGGIENGIK